MYKMRDGSQVQDKRLDRLVQFDERSRDYPIRTLDGLGIKPFRSYTWDCPAWLDQGREGACVGFSTTHKLLARHRMIKAGDAGTAMALYNRAKVLDEWAGEAYDGTSILAGMKAAQEAGFIKAYRWAFSLDEALLAIGYNGGGVLGCNWYEGMFEPDEQGFIHPTGRVAGGHAIFVRGINLKKQYVILRNSWGRNWGKDGDCYLSISDFARLLKEDGEFAIPIRK